MGGLVQVKRYCRLRTLAGKAEYPSYYPGAAVLKVEFRYRGANAFHLILHSLIQTSRTQKLSTALHVNLDHNVVGELKVQE